MNNIANLIRQFKTLTPFFIYLYLPPFLCVAWLSLISMTYEISVGDFMIDVTAYANLPPYIGLISNVGVLFMCAGASISLFTWTLLLRNKNNSRVTLFLLFFGLITALLMLDDLFLFHEELFPYLFGISEKVVFMIYGAIILSGAIFFLKLILETEYLIFFSALFFLGISIFFDLIEKLPFYHVGEWHPLFEEGFKLMGMVGWFGYFTRVSFIAINEKKD